MQELFEDPEERLDKVLELRLKIEEVEKSTDFEGSRLFSQRQSFSAAVSASQKVPG